MNLKNVYVILTNTSKNTIKTSNILTLKLKSSRYIPADSLNISLILDDHFIKYSKVELFIENTKVFCGIVDSQSININENIISTSFSCRNITALMLDNEVKPYIYFKLSSEQLIQRHALPFGVKGAIFPFSSTVNFIQIKKGSSHWSVIDLFCKQQYKQTPYLNSEGFIIVDRFSENSLSFSNHDQNSINFISAKILDNRNTILSKVYIKTGLDAYGSSYLKSIENPIAKELDISRERYFNPPKEWLKDSKASAEYFMKKSQTDAFSIALTIPYIINAKVSDSASFFSNIFSSSNLYISQIDISIDQNGIFSYVKLLDKSFF